MKERPILFSAPMVRAILAGRKTQTRRIIKGAPDADGMEPHRDFAAEFVPYLHGEACESITCPYGVPGDRLWVRETWAPNPVAALSIVYRADGTTNGNGFRWHPSIHMPRWASRITLEITSVRVERLQQISQDDAKAEGIREVWPCAWHWQDTFVASGLTPRDAYWLLWDEINGPRAWDANPWVWVVEFKRSTPTKEQQP